MMYVSEGYGEWPPGFYWSPGEIKEVPDTWPALKDAGAPPTWLKPETVVAKPKPKAKAKKED